MTPSEDELIIAYVSPSGYEFQYEPLVATDTTQAKLGHFEQLTFTDIVLGRRISIKTGTIIGCNTADGIRYARLQDMFVHSVIGKQRVFCQISWLKDIGMKEIKPFGRQRVLEDVGELGPTYPRLVGLGILASEPAKFFMSGLAGPNQYIVNDVIVHKVI